MGQKALPFGSRLNGWNVAAFRAALRRCTEIVAAVGAKAGLGTAMTAFAQPAPSPTSITNTTMVGHLTPPALVRGTHTSSFG